MSEYLYIYCDGGARGNPGPAASAFIVKRSGKLIYKYHQYIGAATNNVAEYKGVIAALKWILKNAGKFSLEKIIFSLDSELVTKQLLSVYKTKNQNLKNLLKSAKFLETKIPNEISYLLIPREKNGEADFLVKETLKYF